MVVTKKLRTLFTSVVFLIAAMQNALAEMMAKGRTKVKSVFNFYHQNSDDGHQVVDNSGREEANVFEPMIFVEHQVNEDTAINGQFVFDAWTAASDTKLDTYTGASHDDVIKTQTRFSGTVGARKENDKWTYGGNIGFSSEYDYQSINGSLNIARSFAKDNFTLGLTTQYYLDEVDLFTDLSNPSQATISEGLDRKIFATTLAASQILTPKDIAQFGLTYAHASGFLESTASTVLVGGTRQVEALPDSRDRYAFSSKWVHGMGDASAINTSYRYYFDDWGLDAHTVRLAYLFEYNDDEDFIEVFGRYHNQTAVDYFKSSFDSSETYMTSDSDLEDFSSYEVGLFHNYTLGDKELFGFGLENIVWTNGAVFNTRSNGLRYGYLQTGLGVEF